MIDLQEINETIDQLRRKGDSIKAAEQLALLYIARDHMQREEDARIERSEREMGAYSQAAAPDVLVLEPDSEFLAACNGAPMGEVFAILDAHMETIRVLYPREYEAIVARIKGFS